jgi:TetR/AcrR family transcriptional regulator, regulator of autoinduction and epiphytic fitness
MRTTKSQQAATRRRLIASAVQLMSEHGFDACTLKQIARQAEVGEATVYKYFASKEKLVLGYFEMAFDDALAQWQQTPGQEGFTLQERLQLLMDALLERLAPDRAFVRIARELLQRAPLLMLGQDLPGKALMRAQVEMVLDQAEAAGDIAPCGYKAALGGLMADYAYGVIGYWLRDDSEHQGNTTQLLDLSLEIAVLVLKTGLINKLLALGGFALRSQLYRWMQQGPNLVDALRVVRGMVHQA